MEVFTAVSALVVILVSLFLGRRVYKQRLFHRLGVPTPPDFSFWLGHMVHFSCPKTRHLYFPKICDELGGMWGFYLGTRPCFMISDPELVEEICVRHFESFNTRRLLPMQRTRDDPHADIFTSNGARWRRQRRVVNAAFATGRLRANLELIHRSIAHMDDVIARLRKESKDGSINLHVGFELLSLDVICSFAFGIDLFSYGSDLRNNRLTQLLDEFVGFTRKPLPNWVGIVFALPEFRFIFNNVEKFMCLFNTGFFTYVMRQIEGIINTVITTRLENESTRRRDLLQGMIEHMTEEENPKEDGSLYMTRPEICTTSLIFMFAGQATTASFLAFISYELAASKELQDRLRREIFKDIGETGTDYDSLMRCTYLDWCMKEVLRKYPIGEMTSAREANEDAVIKGWHIPEGSEVQICVRALHYNKEYWGPEDPNLFVPERFTPERVNSRPFYSFLPFGAGPRICPGNRLAEIDIKLCVVFLLRKYNIALAPKQAQPLVVMQADVLVPPFGVQVILTERSQTAQ